MSTTSWDTFKDEVLKKRATFTVKDIEEIVGVSETTARKLIKSATTNGQIAATSTRGEYRSGLVNEPVEDVTDEGTAANEQPAEAKDDSTEDTRGERGEKRRYNYQPKDARDERDDLVLDCIKANGPVARNDIVSLIGDRGDYTEAQVYLSIWRLRKAGDIKRVSIGQTYPGWVKA